MTVLVLTRPTDATADLVISELNDREVPVVRMDPAEFPENATVTARISSPHSEWEGTIRGRHRDLVLRQVTSVYYRRPSPFRPHSGMSEQDAQWASAEARAGLGGLLTSLDCLWVNHPQRNALAGVKPVALSMAVRCGLAVPRTLITNDAQEARAFIEALPGHVAAYKALGSVGPSDSDGKPTALWTTQVCSGDLDDSVALTTHQFQEWITKAYEVRLTVVADRMFAARIRTTSEQAPVDIRTDYDSHVYEPCDVPTAVASGVRRLLEAFGLRYAAIDFLVDDDGTWFLIDLNPNGQWAFIPELRTPITHALADLLEGTTA
ncbi:MULTISPECIES: ATP-grasp ribosomal peptide maturase [unclassified Streptomyces]|uniref:ATP-grasp ribosomal peptide maturase n=1 Tax=unclassified Streptomyces TaxID=2593676 RepID=UPI002E2985F3|nr:ATP-grasp ribosomal peptide maturase [Streptomyces sp. NBC_00223]